ncbi:hypothetical protein BCR33DRAFT_792720 [Rhizoclosmatium globosum]|uniref:Tyr recombinase domain-containing protein n=1 Tax=Rhizoclosmatium globosum TaxID=329046 RepID=A0A1Y2B5I0_9FUNG|nr:hypothetical protein BCR33DRAFT_792720 [Rhizoclosmatium globosum]|eukprot:ORY30092.1 hypothetical protein BCR33DRAFT_792720 [Rhizoclosmatium globosum]
MAVNEDYISARRKELEDVILPQSKKIDAETRQLGSFLVSRTLLPAISPVMATPMDVESYLIHKDRNGNTQFHFNCPRAGTERVGKRINPLCDPLICKIRASPKSIKVVISSLKSGLADLGLTTPWDPWTGAGNPVDSKLIRRHLQKLEDEASDAGVAPLQAPPLFLDQVSELKALVLSKVANTSLTVWRRLYWRQFWLFLLTVGHSGCRPGDLARMRTLSFVWLPNRSGVRCTLYRGKTSTSASNKPFIIKDAEWLKALFLFKRDCAWAGVPLTEGCPFIFRRISTVACLPDRMRAADAVLEFQNLLRTLGSFEGQTLYGFRVGNAIMTSLDTSNIEAVRIAGGWKSRESAERYSQFAAVVANAVNPEAPTSSVALWFAQRSEYAYFAPN